MTSCTLSVTVTKMDQRWRSPVDAAMTAPLCHQVSPQVDWSRDQVGVALFEVGGSVRVCGLTWGGGGGWGV